MSHITHTACNSPQVSSRFLVVVDEGPEEHFAPQFVSPLNNQELLPDMNLLLHTKISASPYVAINWLAHCRLESRYLPSNCLHYGMACQGQKK